MESFGSAPGGSAGSRGILRLPADASWRQLHLGEYPLGEETGLPLIPCPECAMARVIERRSGKEGKNYMRVFFKCPRNGYPKLCGFYAFQRQYLVKLCELGIARLSSCPAMDLAVADEAAAMAEVGEASSVPSGMAVEVKMKEKKQTKKEAKLQAKLDDLLCKFNLLVLVFAVGIGCVVMYLAVQGRERE